MLVTLVLPGTLPELGDPALGRAVRGPGVHKPIVHEQRQHRRAMTLHRLQQGWLIN